jgi:hypothetical protein
LWADRCAWNELFRKFPLNFGRSEQFLVLFFGFDLRALLGLLLGLLLSGLLRLLLLLLLLQLLALLGGSDELFRLLADQREWDWRQSSFLLIPINSFYVSI